MKLLRRFLCCLPAERREENKPAILGGTAAKLLGIN
jgi:hypothetical protein